MDRSRRNRRCYPIPVPGIDIPDGKGGFIIKILKEGGIQGVLSTGILFKHLTSETKKYNGVFQV